MQSRSWTGIIVAAVALLLIGIALWAPWDKGNSGPKGAPPKSTMKAVVLAKGTEVPLILLAEVDAGDAKVGAVVPLLVSQDVCSPLGEVLIYRGSLAWGKVSESRGEGTMSGLLNRPARLAITLDSTEAADSKEVVLVASSEGKTDEPYALTRANTGRAARSAKLDALWAKPESRAVLEKLAQGFATGDASALENLPDAKAMLETIAGELDMQNTRGLIQEGIGKGSKLEGLLKKVRSGSSLAGPEAAAAVGALTELAGLAGEVGDKLAGMLKGRTIRAHPGTPIMAYVAEEATVELRVGLR